MGWGWVGDIRNFDETKGLVCKMRCCPFWPLASGLDAPVSKHRVTMALSCGLCRCSGYVYPLGPQPPKTASASRGSSWIG